MGLIEEFKKFAIRGNVMDMAIGIAIGGAFNIVVNSLVNDILMPPIGYLMGGINFSNYYISLTGKRYATLAEAQAMGVPTINYGVFINNLMNLFFITLALFVIVRWFNRVREDAAKRPENTTKECPYCRMAIPKEATRCAHCTSEV
jgi:large conductance mechanosensitive channel